ncbi:hypothetical protein SLEP1_g59738, partial [Rubroshorea leprosula]
EKVGKREAESRSPSLPTRETHPSESELDRIYNGSDYVTTPFVVWYTSKKPQLEISFLSAKSLTLVSKFGALSSVGDQNPLFYPNHRPLSLPLAVVAAEELESVAKTVPNSAPASVMHFANCTVLPLQVSVTLICNPRDLKLTLLTSALHV